MDRNVRDEQLREVEETQDALRRNIEQSVRLIESSDELLARSRSAPDGQDPA